MTKQNRTDAILAIAAQERQVLRTALQGCISVMEHAKRSPANNHLFGQHDTGTKALNHARQLLKPRWADKTT